MMGRRNDFYTIRWVLRSLLLIGVLAGIARADNFMQSDFRPDGDLTFVGGGGESLATIEIEIAITPAEHARGLMNRGLADFSRGMLFLYRDAAPRSFWMANTPTSLDILFVDDKSRIINIHKKTRPMSTNRYQSAGPAQFVVEVRAGFCDHYAIHPGTVIRWQRR